MAAKPGRNDPCPCGSQRKFKNCCMNKPPAAAITPSLAAGRVAPPAVSHWYSTAMSQLAAGQLRAAIVQWAPQCRRDPLQIESRAFSDQLFAVVKRESDAFRSAPGPATAGRLQQVRLQIVAAVLSAEPAFLATGGWDLFAPTFSNLMDSGVRDLVRSP